MVAHTRYFSSFSKKASFILSVDATFTSTTTLLHSSPESQRSHTRSGLSLAPATRPLPFHSSDSGCSVPTVISSRAVLTVFPLLLVGDQSSPNKDVVEEDVYDDVVAGVDLTTHPLAATDDVLCIQLRPGSAAEVRRLSLLLDDISFIFPTQRIISRISLITFIVF